MALIKCPECGGQVSDKAPACIHCGCPLPSNTASKKFYVNINGRSYDMTELKEMYQAYSPEDQELIYQYCKSTFKKYPTSYNYQELKNCEYRGLDLIQYVKENLKWPDVKAYLTYKFIAKCYKKDFDHFHSILIIQTRRIQPIKTNISNISKRRSLSTLWFYICHNRRTRLRTLWLDWCISKEKSLPEVRSQMVARKVISNIHLYDLMQ